MTSTTADGGEAALSRTAGGTPGGVAHAATGAAGERTIELFGLAITDTTLAAASRWVIARASRRERTKVAFVNAHCVNVARRDASYDMAVGGCDRIFADGAGMRIAAKAAGAALADNVNGTDMLPVLCEEAARTGVSLFFLGAKDGTAAEAARRMTFAYPGLKVAGVHHGYISNPDVQRRAIDAVNASGADILLVGFGVPMQEIWMARNHHRVAAPVIMGVGGLFDYYSGNIPRAPALLRRTGLEWAWRLAMEPQRLARRYLVGNIEFLARVAFLKFFRPAELGRVRHA